MIPLKINNNLPGHSYGVRIPYAIINRCRLSEQGRFPSNSQNFSLNSTYVLIEFAA